ncbi:MAG TPA: Sec-independent protein translocase protein TatB [Gammaproteobacteria bacterium]|nr:Sec-independent protein translocase protein TatB [Gammaproteobacteria bacterium]
MFDFGFSELVLVFIVALLVIGPERLPRVARAAGLWLGRMRNFVQTVKEDIDKELAAEDLKRQLRESKDLAEVRQILDEADGVGRQAKASLEKEQDYLVKAVKPESEQASRPETETETETDTDTDTETSETRTHAASAVAHEDGETGSQKPVGVPSSESNEATHDGDDEASAAEPAAPAAGTDQHTPDESVNERNR